MFKLLHAALSLGFMIASAIEQLGTPGGRVPIPSPEVNVPDTGKFRVTAFDKDGNEVPIVVVHAGPANNDGPQADSPLPNLAPAPRPATTGPSQPVDQVPGQSGPTTGPATPPAQQGV